MDGQFLRVMCLHPFAVATAAKKKQQQQQHLTKRGGSDEKRNLGSAVTSATANNCLGCLN